MAEPSSQTKRTHEDVQPIKLPRPPMQEADMDITPMIDITFLLLIFFIVASRINSDSQVPLPPAHNGTAVATKNSVIVTIAQDTGDQVAIYKGDGTDAENRLASADPADQEAEIVEYLEKELLGGKQYVLIKAGKSVKHREVSRVAKAVGLLEDAGLYVAVLEVQ